MSSLVSIVVPIYNAVQYLDRCIRSVVDQTYTDLEIILVDDGSKDNSLQICEKWRQRDHRIRIISQSNHGVSFARNIGIKKSNGDYLMLLDSDDWLDVEACEKLLRKIKMQNADCVICGFKQTSGNIWAPKWDRDYLTLSSFKQDFIYWINTELLSSSVNKMYKRDLINKFYPEDMSFGEDLIFVLNYLENCKRISFIRESFYQHEVHNSVSLTHSFSPIRFSNLEDIQNKIELFADEYSKSDIRIYRKYIRDALHMIRMLYKNKEVSYKEKRDIINQWMLHSYMKRIGLFDLYSFPMLWKDRMILNCLFVHCFIGINLIVNGKKYISIFSKQ